MKEENDIIMTLLCCYTRVALYTVTRRKTGFLIFISIWFLLVAVLVVAAVVPGGFNPNPDVPSPAAPVEGAPTAIRTQLYSLYIPLNTAPH